MKKKTKKKFKKFESPKKFSAQKRPKTTHFAENGPKMAQKPFLMKKNEKKKFENFGSPKNFSDQKRSKRPIFPKRASKLIRLCYFLFI